MIIRHAVPLAGLATLLLAAAPDAPLHALFREAWEFELRENPLQATSEGDHRYDDRLPSLTAGDFARRERFARETLARLHAIRRDRLESQDRISYDMFERELRDDLARFEFGARRIPINADSGF